MLKQINEMKNVYIIEANLELASSLCHLTSIKIILFLFCNIIESDNGSLAVNGLTIICH